MTTLLLALACSGDDADDVGDTDGVTLVDTDPGDTDPIDTDPGDTDPIDTDPPTTTPTATTGDSSHTADTGGSTTEPLPKGLHGTPPAKPMPPPVFTATNMDGTTRTQPDLIGHPTAMWFYPAAGTGG